MPVGRGCQNPVQTLRYRRRLCYATQKDAAEIQLIALKVEAPMVPVLPGTPESDSNFKLIDGDYHQLSIEETSNRDLGLWSSFMMLVHQTKQKI